MGTGGAGGAWPQSLESQKRIVAKVCILNIITDVWLDSVGSLRYVKTPW